MNLEFKITQKEIKITIALLFFSLIAFFAFKSALYFESQYEESLIHRENILGILVPVNDPFNGLSLSAKSFFVWDMQKEKKLGSLNEELQFPLASLTKLMTILVASESSFYEATVEIGQDDLDIDGDYGLIAGEKWRLSDIIDFVLLTSSNDGAHALASLTGAFSSELNNQTKEELFVDMMNKKAKQLGMSQTYFLNGTGLDVSKTVSGAYGSAKDITILVENIAQEYPNLLEVSSYKETELNSDILVHQISNTNQAVETLPNIVASKTGFTDLAGGNLTVIFDAGIGHEIIISVLGSTKEERFSDVEKLIWASLEKIFKENQIL